MSFLRVPHSLAICHSTFSLSSSYHQIPPPHLDYCPHLFSNSKSQAYDDGRTQLLIQLKGTIAIQFRNNTYNIPIEIWIQRAYPREPPIVYVTPTSDMLVRKGKHVDVSGKVEGGYLEAWSRKWEVSSIEMAMDLGQDAF